MQNPEIAIQIRGARENNLKSLSVDIPLNKLVVVTGVSGSGKSSLAFDVLVNESRRRYLESLPAFSRKFSGKLRHPDVDHITNLPAVIALSQKAVGGGARSTMGTMSGLYDQLRLLYARLGNAPDGVKLSRSLFSFNTVTGACPHCKGLGLEERISLDKLITNPARSLREGVLAPTLPTGYIMYSQLTMESLNLVCEAHGFKVDIPWNELSDEQQRVVLYGSNRRKVPIGKHSLESRMKWSGIAIKPREEDYYKGIINIMTDILRRDRNPNILKYAESVPCSVCHAKRLRPEALSVQLKGKSIDQLSDMEISELANWLSEQSWTEREEAVAMPVIEKIQKQIGMMDKLGMGHLNLSRSSGSLSLGETRRIRLVNQVMSSMSDVLYVFDEAFVGLHPADHVYLMSLLRRLVNQGNTVLLPEHEQAAIRQADYIIDVGPAAGRDGGELLFSGSLQSFLRDDRMKIRSATWNALNDNPGFPEKDQNENKSHFYLKKAQANNLKSIDVSFRKGALNVLTGLSGSGKNSLVHAELIPLLEKQLGGEKPERLQGAESFTRLIQVSRKPIGRSPRSNPATYTGLSDALRDIFARQDLAKAAGLKKSAFSFNTKGGRCETCQGAGRIQVGMHFLGNVDVICPECGGKRFKSGVLDITFKGKNMAEVYDMSVQEASEFFSGNKKIMPYLNSLLSVGLGYLSLGQPSTTLSGGEAQRIKLASHLRAKSKGENLYVLNQPGNGLHSADIRQLLQALRSIANAGHTVICLAQSADFLRAADHLIELGPGRGKEGGRLIFQGHPSALKRHPESLSYKSLTSGFEMQATARPVTVGKNISLKKVHTHNLKNIDVDIPKGKLTVLTGISGSGKSSLAMDSLAAEATSRFTEGMSAYARSFLQQAATAQMDAMEGLPPVRALGARNSMASLRSTVGTLTGLYDYYRLLYSRIAQLRGCEYTARHFSFNHQLGACPACDGLGVELKVNPRALISHPELPVTAGAMKGSAAGRYFGNPDGQFVAVMKAAAAEAGLDLDKPWQELSDKACKLVLYGSGESEYELDWHFKTKTRSGVQHLTETWPGFAWYIEDEYRRKHKNKTSAKLRALLHEVPCSTCGGARLRNELLQMKLLDASIADLSDMTAEKAPGFFEKALRSDLPKGEKAILEEIYPRVRDLMQVMQELGTGYLSMNRGSGSLSGGEMQRVRLAGSFASPLYGMCYVLDEPSQALHEADIPALLKVLKRAVKRGNTLLLTEHNRQVMEAADHIIELGPGSGEQGGEIVARGRAEDIRGENTPTGRFLAEKHLPEPEYHQLMPASFGVKSARANNLKRIDVDFASGGLIAISGVSGSGKSSLLRDVFYASVQAGRPVNCDAIYGTDQFDSIVYVDAGGSSTNRLSTLVSMTGLLDKIRDVFAKTDAAKAAGLKKTAFSYIHKDGKCPVCGGSGVQRISMDFMSDVELPCEACQGARYRPEVLDVTFQGKTIAGVLDMTVSEAAGFFVGHKSLQNAFALMAELGLSHLKLGHAAPALSSGEARRVRLLTDLLNSKSGKRLYLFDEPSRGLHHEDALRLLSLLHRLAENGHSLLYIEHRPEMIAAANQHIKLGPGSGDAGGELM